MKSGRTTLAALIGGVALGTLLWHGQAEAAVVTTYTNASLSAAPIVATFAGGIGSLSFTAASTGYGPGAAVATGGNAMVAMIFGGVADYGSGVTFDGSAGYGAVSTPAVVQYSAADDFIGFTYRGTDGIHYGYAEIFGPDLVGYAYETTAGANIATNAVTPPTSVPEPASALMLVAGLAGVIALASRTRRINRRNRLTA